jgi:NTE family protein
MAGTRALVLGGGGVAGLAWAIGMVAGFAQAGQPVHDADMIVGTSAGAALAALLVDGPGLPALVAAQLSAATDERWRPFSRAEVGRLNQDLLRKVGGDIAAARRRIGAYAMRADVPSPADRLGIIQRRLGDADWTDRELRIIAVDARTGERVVLSRESGVSLTKAVAASCSVPGAWSPVDVGDGRLCIDGGIWSITNADIASAASHVTVLAPLGYGDDNPIGGLLRAEVATLEAAGCTVTVIAPDAPSDQAMSDNVLDPARRADSVRAGLNQVKRHLVS